MATYYHGNSEIAGGGGGDGLQTLILMNPAYVGYSDAGQQPPSSNFVFLNSTSTVNTLPHAPPSNGHHLVGFQLQNTTSTSTASPQEQQQQHGFLQSVPYNLYNLPVENAAARAQQGLSLSLSSQHPPPDYGSLRASPPRREEVRASGGSPSPASGVSNGVESVLLSSKYLSAAQELLDEVVNVGKGAKTVVESSKGQAKSNGDSATAASGEAHSGGGDSSGKRGAELTTAERQEIQMKKAKLVNMLDEVEQRYKQYQQQMQMVITWFEQAAGTGAAKTYTAVALETISKQFRCLKDAIIGQIRGASKSLGQEENNNVEGGGSRLKYVDNQMRQQRALQQLGMIHHNAAWRPQRGLPERSVSVLRAWLFEHFLHPYPKDSDKLMLAKQTGLTRSQVSNWFINARVRLWKPMVEEMYTEEMKDHDKNGNANDTTTKIEQKNDDNPTTKSATTPQVKSPASEQQRNKTFVDNFINNNTVSPPPRSPTGTTMPSFNLISETGSSPKKLRISNMLQSTTTVAATIPPSISMDSKPDDSDNDTMLMKFGGGGDRQDREGFTLMGAPTNFIGGFGAYPMGDLGRFGTEQFQPPYSGNGVSLTLGLPHCEMSGAHQSFLPNQTMQLGRSVEIGEANDFGGMDASANAHSANVYDINIQNRKRFAAQLLPDFVA